jgi:hypothetical protein
VTTTAATAKATATTAAAAIFAWSGFVDRQVASVDLFAIELFNGSSSFFLGCHFDEAEAS